MAPTVLRLSLSYGNLHSLSGCSEVAETQVRVKVKVKVTTDGQSICLSV
jgi:hypothetical protein